MHDTGNKSTGHRFRQVLTRELNGTDERIAHVSEPAENGVLYFCSQCRAYRQRKNSLVTTDDRCYPHAGTRIRPWTRVHGSGNHPDPGWDVLLARSPRPPKSVGALSRCRLDAVERVRRLGAEQGQ